MGRNNCIAYFVGHSKLIQYLSRYFYLILFACLFACESEEPKSVNQNDFLLDAAPQRIITLAPHLTELLFSLGVQNRIIATVEYSDYPEDAISIPRIGDAFRIDWEKLAQLKPDLILAWEGGNPKHLITEIERRGYRVEKFPNASLFQLPQQIQAISNLLKVPPLGISEQYKQELQALVTEFENKKNIAVFYQISTQPIYSIGSAHTISEMLRVCGARNVFSDHVELASPLSPEAVLAAKPEVILTTNQSYEQTSKSWEKLESISQASILKVSGDEVSRASLRMLQGTRNICEALDVWRNNKFSADEQ